MCEQGTEEGVWAQEERYNGNAGECVMSGFMKGTADKLFGCQIKKNEMDGACGKNGGEDKCILESGGRI